MENDKIGEPSGEFQKLCVRFKTPEIAKDFQLAYRNAVSNPGSQSAVIFVQPDSQIPVAIKSPDHQPASPEAKSPPPAATFSFGDKPAEIPTFGGFSFSSNQNTGGFNFGGNSGGFSFDKPAANPFGFK